MVNRWGNPVNHSGGGDAPLSWWNPDGTTSDALTFAWDATGAASYAASLIELAHGGAALTEIGGGPPSWAAGDGWDDFLVLTRCLDTGIIPDEGWSMLVQFTDWGTIDWIAGMYNDAGGGNATFGIEGRAGDVRTWSGTSISVNTNAPVILAGNYGIAGKTPYRDGIAEANVIPAGACIIPISCFIGALDYDGGALSHTSAKIRAVLLYDGILTAPQMLARATTMAAL